MGGLWALPCAWQEGMGADPRGVRLCCSVWTPGSGTRQGILLLPPAGRPWGSRHGKLLLSEPGLAATEATTKKIQHRIKRINMYIISGKIPDPMGDNGESPCTINAAEIKST